MAGGFDNNRAPISSTELMNFMDQSSGWRDSCALPMARFALAGTTISGVFHVTGGSRKTNQHCNDNHEILAWDPVGENWTLVGHTIMPRDSHAVTEVDLDDLKTFCTTTSTTAIATPSTTAVTTNPVTTTNTATLYS